MVRHVLQEKSYVYSEHWAPHDIEARELGAGKSRLEVGRDLGLNFRVVPKLDFADGIEAARGGACGKSAITPLKPEIK